MTLNVPWRLSSLKRADTVIVPGIDNIDRPLPREVVRALRAAINRHARVASICTGAFILARTGALDGLKATTHWLVAQELARRHPAIDVDPDVLYVDNGSVLTSAGAAAGFDLCLHLVRRDLGAEIAARAARAAVMPLERSGGQAQFIVYEQPAEAESMGPLLRWIEQNAGKQLSLSAIARHAAMSTRTLSRRFREQVGATPVRWIAGARVRRALARCAETTSLSIEQIATEEWASDRHPCCVSISGESWEQHPSPTVAPSGTRNPLIVEAPRGWRRLSGKGYHARKARRMSPQQYNALLVLFCIV